jgi:hypothetical protein
MLRGAPLPSGGRAFGPSDRGILQEILEFSLDTPPLGGGWLRHRSEQYCCCSQILADPAGGRGQPCPGIVVNAVAIIGAFGEAVVTCGHEASHDTGITEPGEIPTRVGLVLFLGTRRPVGRDSRQSVLG